MVARLGQARSVWSIWLVSCNQTNQTDRIDQMDKTGWRLFSILLVGQAFLNKKRQYPHPGIG